MSRTYKDRRRAKALRLKQKRSNQKMQAGKEAELARVAELKKNDYWTREREKVA